MKNWDMCLFPYVSLGYWRYDKQGIGVSPAKMNIQVSPKSLQSNTRLENWVPSRVQSARSRFLDVTTVMTLSQAAVAWCTCWTPPAATSTRLGHRKAEWGSFWFLVGTNFNNNFVRNWSNHQCPHLVNL